MSKFLFVFIFIIVLLVSFVPILLVLTLMIGLIGDIFGGYQHSWFGDVMYIANLIISLTLCSTLSYIVSKALTPLIAKSTSKKTAK